MMELRKRKSAPLDPPRIETAAAAQSPTRASPAAKWKSRVSKKSKSAISKGRPKPKPPPRNTSAHPQATPLAQGDKIPLDMRLGLYSEGKDIQSVNLGDVLAKSDKNGIIVFVFGKALSGKTQEFIEEMEHSLLDLESLQMTTIGLSSDTSTNISKLLALGTTFEYLGDPQKQLLTLLGIENVSPTDKKGHVGLFIVGKKGGLLRPARSGKSEWILDHYLFKDVDALAEALELRDESDII
ncbi:hypothetical protein BJX64DRAFT_120170 [Aspergillus heterothallicus]